MALDPYNKATGISEDDIPDVILPQATSAKAACALLGHIIETAGCAEGFGVGFIDAHDVWYLETGTDTSGSRTAARLISTLQAAIRGACAPTIRRPTR